MERGKILMCLRALEHLLEEIWEHMRALRLVAEWNCYHPCDDAIIERIEAYKKSASSFKECIEAALSMSEYDRPVWVGIMDISDMVDRLILAYAKLPVQYALREDYQQITSFLHDDILPYALLYKNANKWSEPQPDANEQTDSAASAVITVDENIKTNSKKKVGSRGRSKKPFEDLVADKKRATEVLKCLHGLIDGKSNKEAVIYILAAIQLGLVQRPTHAQFREEFGELVAERNYNILMKKEPDKLNLDGAKAAISRQFRS